MTLRTARPHAWFRGVPSPVVASFGVLLLALTFPLVACTDGGDRSDAGAGASTGEASTGEAGSAMGPGLSVAEALRSRAEPPYLVNGYLWKVGDEVRLCSSLDGASPPRCGGPSLRVRGADLAKFAGLRTQGDTTWSERPAQVLGGLDNGVLTVAGASRG